MEEVISLGDVVVGRVITLDQIHQVHYLIFIRLDVVPYSQSVITVRKLLQYYSTRPLAIAS